MRNTIMCVVLTILGIGMSWWGYGIMSAARASLEWPIAQGIVTVSDIKISSTSGQQGYQHSADIRYEYRVNGKAYKSNEIVVGDYSGNSANRAEKLTRQYKKGSNVKVYYNYKKPSEAVLIPGGTILVYIPFGFGIIATISGIMALIFRMRKRSVKDHEQ